MTVNKSQKLTYSIIDEKVLFLFECYALFVDIILEFLG